ncbi:SDR family oxidoreductase [Streptomyces bauhiniae]|uniref:SDR family oxidoreductase n=1 Tax=Streptomyces bauhiniae TaxID=2340725 RepID=UPI003646678D
MQVLVTGGSGFLAAHCIAQLLERGYRVRTTVRSHTKEKVVTDSVRAAGVGDLDRLSFAVADLTRDQGWAQAVDGCAYVLHVASPFPTAQPKDEDELIGPAREGTLRVLRAARASGVRRLVHTSSFGAVGYGHADDGRAFTEDDWSETSGPGVTAYIKSKTLAERAAWDFVKRDGAMELAVVNPVGIFGPVLGPHLSGSLQLIQAMMDGKMPGIPDLSTAVVDVRDVADLHLRAMTAPEAAGQRFIAAAGHALPFSHIADTLRRRLGEGASKVPTRRLPSTVVRLGALVVPAIREMRTNLGVVRHVDAAKARTVLGWSPRSSEDTVTASGQSLLDRGLLTTNR